MASPNNLSSEMALFSLSQKIFVIKSYYKSGESVKNVLDCLYRRYGIKNANNARVISQIIRAFENTGNILNRFYYNVVAGSGAMKIRRELLPNQPGARKRPHPQKKVVAEKPPIDDQDQEEIVEEQEVMEEELDEKTGKQTTAKKGATGESGENSEEEIIFEVLHEDAVELFADFEAETENAPVANPSQQMITVARLPVKLEATAAGSGAKPSAAAGGIAKPPVQNTSSTTVIKSTTTPPKNFSLCPECGETVPMRKYAMHQRRHKFETENNQIHECPNCARVFLNGVLMKAHIRDEHGPSFICEICAKVSRTKATHRAHMFVHETERPHRCTDCPKTFVRAEGLRRHRMTHTGEKPFTCQYCNAQFGQFMGWQMHLRLHTGERPYACKHCDKRFIGSPALNAHLKSAHFGAGEYEHQCSMCSGRYKTEKTLHEHMAAKHGVVEEMIEEVEVVAKEEIMQE